MGRIILTGLVALGAWTAFGLLDVGASTISLRGVEGAVITVQTVAACVGGFWAWRELA